LRAGSQPAGINRRPPRRSRKTSGLLFEARWFYWGLWGGVAYISAAPKRFLDPSFFQSAGARFRERIAQWRFPRFQSGKSLQANGAGNWLHKK